MRNYSIDTLKFICAVLIVLLHVKFRGHSYCLPVTRCAVPCFFIISGYFLMGDNIQQRMTKGIQRMVCIIFYSSLLFIFVTLAQHRFALSSIVPTAEEIFNFILLNANPWGFHLWYLGAYLYVLVICLFIDKYKKWDAAFIAVPVLLVFDLLLGKYSLLIIGQEYPYIYVRNFLFVGLPYFLVGSYMRRENLGRVKYNTIVWGGVVFLSLVSVLENRLLVYLCLNATRDHYLSTTPLAILLFAYFLSRNQNTPTVFSTLGSRDSLYIYILHPLWIFLFDRLNPHLPQLWRSFYAYTAPVMVLGGTMMLIVLLRYFKIIR